MALLLGALLASVACSKRDAASEKRASTNALKASSAATAVAPASPTASEAPAPPPAKPDPPPPAPEPPDPPTARSETVSAPTVTDVFDDYGFPAYTAVEHLCGGRDILGDGEHNSWDVFTSSDPTERIVAAYRQRLGATGLESEAGATTWRLPPGSPAPQRTLRVSAPDRPGKHTTCKTKAPAGAKSVVILTRRS